MESRPNTLATVSLVCGVLLVVCYFAGFCISFIPFVGLLAVILMPIEWILAFAGLITGILGYRASRALDGQGQGAALLGTCISGGWLLLQVLLMVLLFLGVTSLVFLSVLGAALEA